MAIRKLGSLNGNGRLLGREDYVFGPVQYQIEVFATERMKMATGTLTSEPIALLDANRAPAVFLELASGQRVEIILTSSRSHSAEFKTTGEAPEV